MCGIAGFVSEKPLDEKVLSEVANSLIHRGPDAQQFLQIPSSKVSFVHTRLSFLDLSEKGNQPMHFPELGLTITYNGEVYNFPEIKQELEQKGHQFITSTDTEVILKAWHAWGEKAVDKFSGMFAFAIYDSNDEQLYLARDRFGIKPLYYGMQNGIFAFASELKAFHASRLFQMEVDWSAVCDYFVYRYVPSPKSIYNDFQKLPPAHLLKFDVNTKKIAIREYWKLESGDQKDVKDQLPEMVGEILERSVRIHNRADVPVGAFLSGGYDSSAILTYLKDIAKNPIAFSIGFKNWENSEDQFAEIVADHLKVKLKKEILDETSLSVTKLMPLVYDEPIADISIIPTYLVSKLARKDVKAVMSGEGADEIFGGYWWQKEFYRLNKPEKFKDRIKTIFKKADPLQFYADAASMGNYDREGLKKMLHPDLHQYIPDDPLWFYRKYLKQELSPLKQMQYMDIKCFMAELILVKVDRASMANSLELRVPFLDHKLFELIFSYTETEYYKPDITKYLLCRNIEYKLPKAILNRGKQGFVGPDRYYMERDFYRGIFEHSSLQKDRMVSQNYLDSLLQEDYDWKKWKVAVFDNWFGKWGKE